MIPYSLHVAILLAVCLLFYKLLLQKETYYNLNRWILLACLLLAFVLPVIQVPQKISFRSALPKQDNTTLVTPANPIKDRNKAIDATSLVNTDEILQQNVIREQSAASVVQPNAGPQINKTDIVKWAVWLYWAGCVVFATNFLLQIIVLLYQAYKKPVIRDGNYRIVEIDEDKAPCSFGNNIFINPAKYDWETYKQILLHEKVHIQQGHTFDLIIAELMLVMQWFNPFAWRYRTEVENNLEFLTDDAIIHQHKVDAEAYQLSLLKVSVPNYAMHMTTNYNQSLLKKRILMMNAKRSNIHTGWKYFMLAPLLVILVFGLNEQVASSSPITKNKRSKTVTPPYSKKQPGEIKELPAVSVNTPGNGVNVKRVEPITAKSANAANNDIEDSTTSIKPGDINLKTFMQDNWELIKHGEFKKALQRHIWYHDHALEYDRALTGVRLSFALNDWKKLGEQYPPALEAMKKIRDKKTRLVTKNGSTDLFGDVVALNRTLNEDNKTVDLFKTVEAKQPEAAKSCFRWAKATLFAANQYSTINKYLGDPVKEFENIQRSYDVLSTLTNRTLPNEDAYLKARRDSIARKYQNNNLVTNSVQLIQYTVAINDLKSAKEIQQKALALVKDDRLTKALVQ